MRKRGGGERVRGREREREREGVMEEEAGEVCRVCDVRFVQ